MYFNVVDMKCDQTDVWCVMCGCGVNHVGKLAPPRQIHLAQTLFWTTTSFKICTFATSTTKFYSLRSTRLPRIYKILAQAKSEIFKIALQHLLINGAFRSSFDCGTAVELAANWRAELSSSQFHTLIWSILLLERRLRNFPGTELSGHFVAISEASLFPTSPGRRVGYSFEAPLELSLGLTSWLFFMGRLSTQ